jgi:hypothetical protein
MNPIADRTGHTGVDPRMKLMLALAVVVGLLAVPQRTGAALLAPQADGFLGDWPLDSPPAPSSAGS